MAPHLEVSPAMLGPKGSLWTGDRPCSQKGQNACRSWDQRTHDTGKWEEQCVEEGGRSGQGRNRAGSWRARGPQHRGFVIQGVTFQIYPGAQ